MAETRVDTVYARLKAMLVDFRIRPGTRLNEVALARELDASRTPLREALNRLVAERLVTAEPGAGFFCRALDPEAVFALYEAREAVEAATVRLACQRATDADLARITAAMRAGLNYVGRTVREVVADDEAFHLAIAAAAGNDELHRMLVGLNERIRYLRWVNMRQRIVTTKREHRAILAALRARDAGAAEAAMRAHIARRMDQVTAAVREGYANLYVPGNEVLFDSPLGQGDAA